MAFRFIAGNEHPDHDTIAALRKRFLGQIESLFVEVPKLARTMGMLKLGTVALDGTKVVGARIAAICRSGSSLWQAMRPGRTFSSRAGELYVHAAVSPAEIAKDGRIRQALPLGDLRAGEPLADAQVQRLALARRQFLQSFPELSLGKLRQVVIRSGRVPRHAWVSLVLFIALIALRLTGGSVPEGRMLLYILQFAPVEKPRAHHLLRT